MANDTNYTLDCEHFQSIWKLATAKRERQNWNKKKKKKKKHKTDALNLRKTYEIPINGCGVAVESMKISFYFVLQTNSLDFTFE